MNNRQFARSAGLAVALFAAGVVGVSSAQDRARPPAGKPFPDPQAMMERFFGAQTEEDRQALAKIQVSAQEERQMGEAAVQVFLADLKRQGIRVVSRGKEVQYLRDLVDTIRPLMTNGKRYRTITIYVVESPECEAKSFPGGTLVFFRGLLDSAETEAALIAIVGHELAHLDRGHQLVRAKQMKLMQQTFSGKSQDFSPERFFSSGMTMMRIWSRPFRPEDESVADGDGARWAYRVGYDPREMARLIGGLGQKRPALPLPTFLQSHPDPDRRAKAILELYDDLQKRDPKDQLYLGKENLKRRVARSRTRFEE